MESFKAKNFKLVLQLGGWVLVQDLHLMAWFSM